MLIKSTSSKKQQLIDAFLSTSFEVGEHISVYATALRSYAKAASAPISAIVKEVLPDGLIIVEAEDHRSDPALRTIAFSDVKDRSSIYDIGVNPFPAGYNDSVRFVAYSTESILFNLNVVKGVDKTTYDIGGVNALHLNWNPFIYDKNGNKQYYQRPFVWSLTEKQLLVESIYMGIDCGKILVRKRGWKELEAMVAKGETEIAFNDIVDGKQRLNALKGFIENDYPDMHGNYFGDLSNRAQHAFTDNQAFGFAEMPEYSKDEAVLNQFLRLNFTGIPQSKEHIEFVKSLKEKL